MLESKIKNLRRGRIRLRRKISKMRLGLPARASQWRSGQSLVEILVAMVIGVIMIMGAVSIIVPTIRTGGTVSKSQIAITFGKELLDNIRVYGEADWHNIAALSTSSGNFYYLNTTSSPFTIASGTETRAVGTTTYSRYFSAAEVQRNYAVSGQPIVTSGGTFDPSTRKITVVYGWSGGPTTTIATYLTRARSQIYLQTDWLGGPGQDGPATSTNNKFATSSNINYSTTTGSILINL